MKHQYNIYSKSLTHKHCLLGLVPLANSFGSEFEPSSGLAPRKKDTENFKTAD
jgi:hypothetical protein